jgi:hypothetical protein
MKAKFKMNDEFRLREDMAFTRSFPLGGYNSDGSVRDIDKANKKAGSVAAVYEIHDSPSIEKGEVWYSLEFGDLKVNLNEQRLLESFEPVERQGCAVPPCAMCHAIRLGRRSISEPRLR